jgi:hypothetical protein
MIQLSLNQSHCKNAETVRKLKVESAEVQYVMQKESMNRQMMWQMKREIKFLDNLAAENSNTQLLKVLKI